MIETRRPITFSQLVGEHERIKIPRLQRDYAQGRTGAKETEVRKHFLAALGAALDPNGAGVGPLNLDFVYGSAETSPDPHFSLLDGQQRLTTLFLLHWLVAWRDGATADFTSRFVLSQKSRFSYLVRSSSVEFFDMLVLNWPMLPASEIPDLKVWITDQHWYFRYWRLDPTVQGVLEMLQAMHVHFQGRPNGLYARLIDTERPAITFQLLNLGEFPLSDDLYIKMNSRGKPLTSFETFKARYEQLLPGHFSPGETRGIGGVPFSLSDFVARRMDTAWTDFFWGHHKAEGHFDPARLDESFMNVFRMVALVSREPGSAGYDDDIELLRDGTNPPTYSSFASRRWLDQNFSAFLLRLMESWSASALLLPPGGPFDERAILNQLFKNPADLKVPQVVLFCGYAHYVREHEGRIDPVQFAAWMRVIHNFGINSDFDRNDRLETAVKGLKELLPHSVNILPRIVGLAAQGRVTGFAELQQREEALKAGLLLTDTAGWGPLIERAERHGYFRGQIAFLLDFAGVKAEWIRTGTCAWDVATHQRLQRSFARYSAKAELMFNADGLIDVGEKRWQRALLSVGDYLLLRGNTNFSFLENDRSQAYSWKRLLRDDHQEREFLKQLWDQIDEGQPLAAQLDDVIATATGMEPWREALAKSAAAVTYCCTIQREPYFTNQVYLLQTTQRRGWHAELFTFILDGHLRQAEARQSLSPLRLGDYQYSRLVDDPPHLPIYFPSDGVDLCLEIQGRDGKIQLWIETPLTPSLIPLFTQAGFAPYTENPLWLLRTADFSNVEPALRQLAALLAAK